MVLGRFLSVAQSFPLQLSFLDTNSRMSRNWIVNWPKVIALLNAGCCELTFPLKIQVSSPGVLSEVWWLIVSFQIVKDIFVYTILPADVISAYRYVPREYRNVFKFHLTTKFVVLHHGVGKQTAVTLKSKVWWQFMHYLGAFEGLRFQHFYRCKQINLIYHQHFVDKRDKCLFAFAYVYLSVHCREPYQ